MNVRLDDVAAKVSGNEDRFTTNLQYYLGGEHYEEERIAIYKRGIIKDNLGVLGFKFHFPFKAGDTIFMSRNPHLKKAGMITYDGICSDTSYILRTKDDNVLYGKYLPLVLQNACFWTWFEENKSGSVNYLLNWKALKEYEFNLPPIETQRKIADTVWAIERTCQTYVMLLQRTDELVNSRFTEMFDNGLYEKKELNEISVEWFKGQPFKKENITTNGQYACIHYGELFTKYGPYIDSTFSTTNVDSIKTSKSGDILFPASDVTPDGLTKCSAILKDGVILGGDIIALRPVDGFNPVWLSYAIRMQKEQLLSRVTGSVVRHISAKGLKTVTIPIPPIGLQEEFEQFLRQSVKSKAAIERSLNDAYILQKKIINENIGREN